MQRYRFLIAVFVLTLFALYAGCLTCYADAEWWKGYANAEWWKDHAAGEQGKDYAFGGHENESIPPTAGPWMQQEELTDPDGTANDNFGAAFALSADGGTALIGAFGENSGQGTTYVFTLTGSPRMQRQELTAADGAANDNFGAAFALSADGVTALIGAPGKNSYKGALYVFTLRASTWIQQQELAATDGTANDLFGGQVALSADGETAFVCASGKNAGQGAAYVFTQTGSRWTQQQELTAPNGGVNFCEAVALSADGETALINGVDVNSSLGVAWIFTRNEKTWTPQQELTPSDGEANDNFDSFGTALALSADGGTALVGEWGQYIGKGAAYVFTRRGSNWTQQWELTASDGAAATDGVGYNGDAFGTVVSLSNDGGAALIGAPGKNSFQGAAYVFTLTGNAWTQQQELTASDGIANDLFGFEGVLDAAGATALIGAPGKNSSAGAAYLFTLTDNDKGNSD